MRHAHCTASRGKMFCSTARPQTQLPLIYATVSYALVSRHMLRADRTWNLADSVRWQRVIDSTRSAVMRNHREALPCDTSGTGFPIAEAWRAGSDEIRLYAAPARLRAGHDTPWFASVLLVRGGSAGCGARFVSRLLTPAEVGRAIREWVEQRFGLP